MNLVDRRNNMDKDKIKETDMVKEKMGSEITLYDDKDNEFVFQLIMELIYENNHYAYFQSPDSEDGDIEVLKVVKDQNGEIDLEFIEDDDEWENASELFDEWTYSFE